MGTATTVIPGSQLSISVQQPLVVPQLTFSDTIKTVNHKYDAAYSVTKFSYMPQLYQTSTERLVANNR
jgi:hypothetical protein